MPGDDPVYGRRSYDGGLEEVRKSLEVVRDVAIETRVLLQETRRQLDQRQIDGANESKTLASRLAHAEAQLSELRGGMATVKVLVPLATAVLSAVVTVAVKVFLG